MNAFKWIVSFSLLAGSAFAQNEQWLEYHIGEGQGYVNLKTTNAAPAGVALPKDLSGKAIFARWTTPMDPSGGRWLCLDRTRRYGVYNRVFIDSNGNGRLDDEKPVMAKLDAYNARFAAIPVVFKGEDGPVTYHLALRVYQYDNNPAQVMASSAGTYEGMVNFDGVKKKVRLVDASVNGAFDDIAASPYSSDHLEISTENGSQFLGKMVEVDGKFFSVEVARDGAFIKVKKLENVTLGTIEVPKEICEFQAYGNNGHFIRTPKDGKVTLPTGKYRIVEWAMNKKDEKGASWKLSADRFSEKSDFEVTTSASKALKIGEPVKAELKVSEEGNRRISFELRFVGHYDEDITMERNGNRPPRPKLTVASADGSLTYTNSFEYG